MKMLQSDEVTIHIDATGTIIRRPNTSSKKMFYYAAAINVNHRILTISNYHDSATIGSLSAFKAYVIRMKGKWPVFNHVVCDFSFAILNAIVIFWNNTDVVAYLRQTYEVVTG